MLPLRVDDFTGPGNQGGKMKPVASNSAFCLRALARLAPLPACLFSARAGKAGKTYIGRSEEGSSIRIAAGQGIYAGYF